MLNRKHFRGCKRLDTEDKVLLPQHRNLKHESRAKLTGSDQTMFMSLSYLAKMNWKTSQAERIQMRIKLFRYDLVKKIFKELYHFHSI